MGDESHAGGTLAEALHDKAYVISGGSTTVSSSAIGEYTSKYPTGYRLYTADDESTGVSMGAGDTSWSVISLKAKKDVVDNNVNFKAILDHVDEIPITRWKYKGQEQTHISPFADDFRTFKLGSEANWDKIQMLDLVGVLYACVKGLKSEIKDLNDKLDTL